MTNFGEPRWRRQKWAQSEPTDETTPAHETDDRWPTDDTRPAEVPQSTDEMSLVPAPVEYLDGERSLTRRDSKHTLTLRKRSERDHRKVRSTPSSDEGVTMEDGGLVIVDQHGNPRHVAPGAVTSSLRYLVARLMQDRSGDVPERVAFTSALSGEGVTFIANSFASVLAHDLHRHVCIVDVNWWPSDADNNELGIYDVMHRDLEISDVLIPTQSPNLSILPAGRAPVSIRPALARDSELAKLLVELDRHFDHLVFDLPAVLVTSDAVALAELADGVGLVVRQGVATGSQLARTLDELGRGRSFGVILNQTRSSIPRLVRRLVGL